MKNFYFRFCALFFIAFAAASFIQAQCPIFEFTDANKVISDDFNYFQANGVSKNPSTGQLCTNRYRFSGFSDGAVPYEGNSTANDYTRGLTGPGVPSNGGLYSLNGNGAIYLQSSSDDLNPGEFEMRVYNHSSETLNTLYFDFSLMFYNDGGYSTSLKVEYAQNTGSYINIFSGATPGPADTNPVLSSFPLENTINLASSMAPGDSLFIRFSMDKVSGGSGTQDEIGFDDFWLSTTPPTKVTAKEETAQKEESDGTYDLCLSISNPSMTNATTVELAYTGGNGSVDDIDNYTTQTVTFPAGSSADQCISINITDDIIQEQDESFEFTLQNISGGNKAGIGLPDKTKLTIPENDVPDIVINEVFGAPSTVDINNDGHINGVEDEFLEIYNKSNFDAHLNGWTISDNIKVRYTFGDIVLKAYNGMVIFSGGTPTGFSCQTISVGGEGLSIDNYSDNMTISDLFGTPRDNIIYTTDLPIDESLARKPDFTGIYYPHHTFSSAYYSPCLKNVSGAPLPITWLAFDAQYSNNQTLLTWQVSATDERSFYTPQRSENGTLWSDLPRVEQNSARENNGNTTYQDIDYLTPVGVSYYRIKASNPDGTTEYSQIRRIQVAGGSDRTLLFPVPVRQTLFIHTDQEKLIAKEVINSNGEVILMDHTPENSIQVGTLDSGIYYLKTISKTGSTVTRFVKQ